MQQNAGAVAEPTIETPHQTSIYNGNLEKLLIDAQRESRTTSYANSKESSARGSPKSPPSPTNTDWGNGDGRTRLSYDRPQRSRRAESIETTESKLKSELCENTSHRRDSSFVHGIGQLGMPDCFKSFAASKKQVTVCVLDLGFADMFSKDPGSDWIWDWSSGPEIQPPGDWSEKFRHPGSKPRRVPAKAPVTKSGIFRLENLPTLLLTHACTFFLGAAFMFMYLKKYCNWTAVVSSTLD